MPRSPAASHGQKAPTILPYLPSVGNACSEEPKKAGPREIRQRARGLNMSLLSRQHSHPPGHLS